MSASAIEPAAMQVIRDEHSAIAAVLYTLRFLVRKMRDGGTPPDLPLLRAILDYIVSYPDRWHHPKEDLYLFATVQDRTHSADALIEQLSSEHRLGYELIEALQHSLLALHDDRPASRHAFFEQAERYVELEWAHMRKEEERLFPIAERHLTLDDWASIHQAFLDNDNPLFGLSPKADAERLYQRILQLAPAPIGCRP